MLPHQQFMNKLNAGTEDCGILFMGDSCVQGFGDTTYGGYPERLCRLFAAQYDYNMYIATWWNRWDEQPPLAESGHVSPVLHMSAPIRGASAPNLYCWQGGISGASLVDLEQYITLGITNVDPVDFAMIGIGFNDMHDFPAVPGFQPAYATFITNLQAAAPGIPIIATDENPLPVDSDAAAFTAGFVNLAQWLTGEGVASNYGLIEANLVVSETVPGVSFMDSRKAYGNELHPEWFSFSLHPNSIGYQASAQWMYDVFLGNIVAGNPPVIATVALDPLVKGSAFSQTLIATGTEPITWSAPGGLPIGLALNPTTGVLSGSPAIDGAYSFTIRASNDVGHDDQAYVGTIASLPFMPTGRVKLKQKLNDQWYPVAPMVKVGGEFKRMTIRD
ncbi:GDSL-type esterase/lipase family protein [Mycobacterium sp. CVI_P3]|uniref:GDSL-type esterase/lipase family protein n=1 Tax=Mycobacterium pinniadriaticum TaxID=2994102 RepID=A0ABT3SEA6_9MYCO|nr:GDSL-type esterase/lipase family protein [Mycobacterium pinniadriaticum]MCX2931422.1 GDSL-type esterase/lipase family protein [Mycobacterium pinniadriaticum]MCX2937846.1 GDSL-type esterase/lipase family protein [Mycobacterium pinniadriaticum]